MTGGAIEPHALPVVDACWNRIGVRGDRSCPELASVIHCHNCRVFERAAQTLLDRPASEAYLRELTKFVAEPADTRRLSDQSVALFTVGGEGLAVATDAVVEVADARPPRRVPHRSNDVFCGLVNIDGQLELCISLHGLLGITRAPTPARATVRVLVISAATQRWVLLVDDIQGVQRFHQSSVIDVPATVRRQRPYIRGLLVADGKHYGLLDLPQICAGLQESLG